MAHDFCSIARVASAAPAASFKPRSGKSRSTVLTELGGLQAGFPERDSGPRRR
jgi:hypothetical protein